MMEIFETCVQPVISSMAKKIIPTPPAPSVVPDVLTWQFGVSESKQLQTVTDRLWKADFPCWSETSSDSSWWLEWTVGSLTKLTE